MKKNLMILYTENTRDSTQELLELRKEFSKVAVNKINKGDNDPLALELYQGHVRLVYDSLSSPPTTVYR